MTATTHKEVQAVSQAIQDGRLRGFASGAREFDDATVHVRGELPGWLRGSLLMNGPALWDLPDGGYRHWFDGLAMLHRVRLGQGEPAYRSRFLRSQDYLQSVAAGKPAKAAFGTDDPPGLWRRLRGIFSPDVTDNNSVVMSRVGSRWIATTEGPRVLGFDPDTLETTGELKFDDNEQIHLMAAHGINDAQGNYWNVGVELGPKCTYKLFRVRPDSMRREVIGRFSSKESGYLHAFAMTPRHAVIWEPALRAQPLGFKFSGRSYVRNFMWKPDAGSMLHTVALADGSVSSWAIPPMMCFHAVQAYEGPDGVVVELAVYDDTRVLDEFSLDVLRNGVARQAVPRLARYRLRPGQSRAEPEIFGADLELPQVNPARWASGQASVAWGAGGGVPPAGLFLDRTFRVDLASGATTVWQRGDAIQLEPLFVARPGAAGEEDGVLLVPTLRDADTGTVVCVVDPAGMKCVAELQLPQVVPFGFHAAWHPN